MLPTLVEKALALAERLGFEQSCSPETGRLLQALAAQRGRTRVAEIGSGCGVGSAWLLAGLAPGVPFVTVEPDDERAQAVADLLAPDDSARVLHGDWGHVLPAEAPFDLLFADGGKSKARPELLGLLAPGGTILMDDLTPGREIDGDPVRELWLRHERVTAVELQVSSRESVILGTLQLG